MMTRKPLILLVSLMCLSATTAKAIDKPWPLEIAPGALMPIPNPPAEPVQYWGPPKNDGRYDPPQPYPQGRSPYPTQRGYPGDMPVPYGPYARPRYYDEFRSYRDFDGGWVQPRPRPQW